MAAGGCASGRRHRAAFVLIAVLIVVLLLSMIALSLLFRLQAEDIAAGAGADAEQAWAAAMSGIEEAMRVAARAATGSMEWQDSPRLFRERLVFDDGANRWFFTVYSAGDPDTDEDIRYGLTDEASKLNVNTASETNWLRLARLPRTLTDAVLDFLDADDTPRPDGAEQEYYDALPRPYKIRNGPLASLEELLLVRGITPALFFGEDANLNFRLDPNENDSDQSFPPDNNDGKLDAGLRQFLTVSSYDLDEDKDGVWRTNLNDPEDPLPTVELPPALTNYITALRSNKITLTHAADLLEARLKVKDAGGAEVEIASGVGKAELPLVLDLFTTTAEARLPGLINILTAPARVLATLPELEESVAESIVSARRGLSADKRQSIAWLYTDDLVPADLFKRLAPRLTTRARQFSFHVVGFGVPCGRFRVLEVIIDCAPERPAITYLRELTRFGLPFPVTTPKEVARG